MSDSAPAQRNIVITGASRGIGRALAQWYLDSGCHVFGISRGAPTVESERYRHLIADVTDEAAVRTAIAQVGGSLKRIDLLINGAAVKHDAMSMFASADDARSMLSTNVLGSFLVTREALRLMKKRRFGRIVNISSVAVPLGSLGTSLYAATKAAVQQIVHSMVREVGNEDITINTIGVSWFEGSGMAETIKESAMAELKATLPKPSALSTGELIHAIEFFASPLARSITDQVVYFGGVR